MKLNIPKKLYISMDKCPVLSCIVLNGFLKVA